MKQLTFKKATLLLAISCSMHARAKEQAFPAGFEQQHTQAVTFTENKGQVGDQNNKPCPGVLFSGTANGLAYHIRNNGISYQLTRIDSWRDADDKMFQKAMQGKAENETKKIPDQTTLYQVDIAWLNQNNNFTIERGNALAGYNNYYLASCPNGALNVKTYTDVTLKNIYNNIDLHYYEKAGALEYDYIVAPNADYHQIQLKVGGAASIALLQDGSVILKTPLGDIIEKAPLVYQQNKLLKAKWVATNNILSFDIHNYNPSLPLIIDPTVSRVWGTYYGGGGNSEGNSCTTDASGNVYMAGYTFETTIALDTIASAGSHQSTFGGWVDAFLVKFDVTGVRQWATYYGGSKSDIGQSCATDALGNVYMSGYTYTPSGDSIATLGSHQPNFGGGYGDAFLVKFNTDGVRQWGTYYGGNGSEIGFSCATDAIGNVYMAGYTNTSFGDTIATASGHQPYFGGLYDAFLVKFSTEGNRLWATYYGGSGYEIGYSCATDALGNVYMSGYTSTSGDDTIATPGSHQFILGGFADAFLVKFNADGIRQWATYYGGSNVEVGYSCAVDAASNVYLAGFTSTSGGESIATVGSHQPVFGGERDSDSISGDAFLVKFNADGLRQWGTYYGGSRGETARSCTIDASNNVYITGYSNTSGGDTIASAGSHQPFFGGGIDAFLVEFNTNGIRQWGTYYGGDRDGFISDGEFGNGCSVDQLGHIYISGLAATYSGEVVATSTGWQPTAANTGGNNYHAYLAQFIGCTSSLDTVFISIQNDTLFASATATYQWYKDAVPISGANNSFYVPTENGNYTVCCTAYDEMCSICSNSFNLTTGISENSLENVISIYPNPSDGNMEFNYTINNSDTGQLKVYDVTGKEIDVYKLNANTNQLQIKLNLTNGIYFYSVVVNDKIVKSDKIVIIK